MVCKLGEPVCKAPLPALKGLWEACGERGIIDHELVRPLLLARFERLVDALQVGDIVEVVNLHAVEERLYLAGGKLGVRERADLCSRSGGCLMHHGHHDGRAVHVDAVDLHVVDSPVSVVAKEKSAPGMPAGVWLYRIAQRLHDGLYALLDTWPVDKHVLARDASDVEDVDIHR